MYIEKENTTSYLGYCFDVIPLKRKTNPKYEAGRNMVVYLF